MRIMVCFKMADKVWLVQEAPLVPVGQNCGERASRIRLMVHRLPTDKVWYLVLVQATLEQGRASGDRAWCHGVVVTKDWSVRTDNSSAVYKGVKEISIHARVRTYDIGRHTVYCYYPKEVARVPEPTDGRIVVFLDGSGKEGQPFKAGAAEVQVKGLR